MILAFYYIGFLFVFFLATKIRVIGHLVDHLLGHLMEHYVHNFDQAITIFASVVWVTFACLVLFPALGLWFAFLSDFATLLFIYGYCNRSH